MFSVHLGFYCRILHTEVYPLSCKCRVYWDSVHSFLAWGWPLFTPVQLFSSWTKTLTLPLITALLPSTGAAAFTLRLALNSRIRHRLCTCDWLIPPQLSFMLFHIAEYSVLLRLTDKEEITLSFWYLCSLCPVCSHFLPHSPLLCSVVL